MAWLFPALSVCLLWDLMKAAISFAPGAMGLWAYWVRSAQGHWGSEEVGSSQVSCLCQCAVEMVPRQAGCPASWSCLDWAFVLLCLPRTLRSAVRLDAVLVAHLLLRPFMPAGAATGQCRLPETLLPLLPLSPLPLTRHYHQVHFLFSSIFFLL